ncbi:MAG: hypothetical protein PWP46_1967, partial [Fusobacteriaceae bacterium]|nr:hypothetical protein [Fusobacteriaceae bacterium]
MKGAFSEDIRFSWEMRYTKNTKVKKAGPQREKTWNHVINTDELKIKSCVL